VALVAVHVPQRVDVHHQRDRGDDEQHHAREPVDEVPELDLERPDREPGDVVLVVRAVVGDPPQHAERQHEPGRQREDPVHRPLARGPLAEEQREHAGREAQQRDQERVLDEPVRRALGDRGGGLAPLLREDLDEAYHLSRSASSTLIEARLRNRRITSASPIPTSAAATAITNSAKIWPETSWSDAENATRFRLT